MRQNAIGGECISYRHKLCQNAWKAFLAVSSTASQDDVAVIPSRATLFPSFRSGPSIEN